MKSDITPEIEKLYFEELLQDEKFVTFIHKTLDHCNIMRDNYTQDSDLSAYRQGQSAVGYKILSWLKEANKPLTSKLLQDYVND